MEFEEIKKFVEQTIEKHNRIAKICANHGITRSDILEVLPLILYSPEFKDEDYKDMLKELCEVVLAVKRLIEMKQLKPLGKIEKENETFYIA